MLSLVLGIVLGAFLYAHFHAKLQAGVAEKEEEIKGEWALLVARAHSERDRLFALLHPHVPPAPVSTGQAITGRPATDGSAAQVPPSTSAASAQAVS